MGSRTRPLRRSKPFLPASGDEGHLPCPRPRAPQADRALRRRRQPRGRLVARIERAILNLADHPLSAPAGIVPGTRQLAIADTPYLVIYRVDADGITILAVLHAARRARS
ncbi:type II toxin-antitoxin system RelE/ParE family toxin [Xanthobacter aminoxidans]|uniref:type II toxin-antitoxin system RelE/ParE family toxin n=1 Tax=Xanthobacter aminoxidans TaxID=186280 RepID=UPI00372D29FD